MRRVPPFRIEGHTLLDATGMPCAYGPPDALVMYKLQHEEEHMNGPLRIKDLAGDQMQVLTAFLERTAGTVTPNMAVAMVVLKGVIEDRALDALSALVLPLLVETYEMYTLTNGEFDACTTQHQRDEWESGIDDAIEKAISPYEKCVTASWFGEAVIDTRFHKPSGKDATHKDEAAALATGFAKDAWRMLTNYMEDDGNGDMVLKTMTADEIASSAGLTRADVEVIFIPQQNPTPPLTEDTTMNVTTLESVLLKISDYAAMLSMTEEQVVPLLENALDEDAGIALSGLAQLGCDEADREPLSMFAMACTGESPADDLYALMQTAEESSDKDEAAQMAELMGQAADAVGDVIAGAVPPVARGRKRQPTTATPGSIPASAFRFLRDTVKDRDEDMATMIGVSRQTFINYGKENAKVFFVPDATQRKALLDLIDARLNSLIEARKLIAIPGQ